MAFIQWADAATRMAAEMDAKLATALEFAFGNSVAFVLAKWRAIVAESKQKKYAMQRLVGLLTGFGLENLGKHVLMAWHQVVKDSHIGTAHLRKAENHHRARILDSVFLSWKIQSMPLTPGEHLKLLGERGDDVWDRDYDDAGDSTQLHAQVLVRRVRSMYDGRDPDSDEDVVDDVSSIRGKTPESGMLGVAHRARAGTFSAGGGRSGGLKLEPAAASASGRLGGGKRTTWADSENDLDSPSTPASSLAPRRLGLGGSAGSAGGGLVGTKSHRPAALSLSARRAGAVAGGGSPSVNKPPLTGGGGGGGGFCGECGSAYTRPGQKFCMECGHPAAR